MVGNFNVGWASPTRRRQHSMRWAVPALQSQTQSVLMCVYVDGGMDGTKLHSDIRHARLGSLTAYPWEIRLACPNDSLGSIPCPTKS